MSKLSDWLRGGADELGWDDLTQRVVDAVAGLARYGERGRVAFPAEVTVHIVVGEGSVDPIERFVARPELDREVEKALANRCDCDVSALPLRGYAVAAGERTSISAVEATPRAWRLGIEGGDLSGRTLVVPKEWTELRFGRGEWHGSDRQVRNDLVVCEKTGFVSRRAGRLVLGGHQLEVTALDQGDALVVRRADGSAVRPARTASGRVAVRAGDVIELEDGGGAGAVRLVVGRGVIQGGE